MARNDLTEQTILDLSGEDELCQVRELVLREHGLSEVGPLLEQLTALEVLSLSNNAVHSLAGCASMGRLTTLNINFNRVASLEPLSSCPLLEKLFASSNKISTVAPLAACTRLKELSLFRNLVASLDGTLAVLGQLTALRVLDLGANPCALGSPYRHRIVSTLRLECLDGDPLTELDGELAADFGASSGARGQGEAAASADTRGAAASGAGSPARRPTTAPARHSKSLFRAADSQKEAACRPPAEESAAWRAPRPSAEAPRGRGPWPRGELWRRGSRGSLKPRWPAWQATPSSTPTPSYSTTCRKRSSSGPTHPRCRRMQRTCPAAQKVPCSLLYICITMGSPACLRASRLTCLSPCAPPHLAPLALRFQPASTRLARPPALGRRRRGGRVRHEPSAANG